MPRSPLVFAQHLRIPLLLTAVVACEGEQGPPGNAGTPGANALSKTSVEPSGSQCAEGGLRLDFGIDTNGNGSLDDSEILNTTYVCNGSGKNSLVRTSPELVGENCPFGGTRIETGLDG